MPHLATALLANEQPIVDQDAQMVGDGRLSHAQSGGQVPDGDFATDRARDYAQQLQPGWISDRTEGSGECLSRAPLERGRHRVRSIVATCKRGHVRILPTPSARVAGPA